MRKLRDASAPATIAGRSSAPATVTAVGRSRATSAANEGPLKAAMRAPGSSSAAIPVISAPVSSSMPFVQTQAMASFWSDGASARATARKCAEGMTRSTMSCAPASARSEVARISGSSAMPGR